MNHMAAVERDWGLSRPQPAAQPRCSRGCVHCTPHHYNLVQGYREERERQLRLAESVALGYASEYQAYTERHPIVTFKEWLIYQRDYREKAA